MADPSLFDDDESSDRGRARHSDPNTSHEAAAFISDKRERAIKRRFLMNKGITLTDDELCARFPLAHPPTVKTARSRLTKAGWLVDTGDRRPSNRGRAMVVWGRPGLVDNPGDKRGDGCV